MTKEGDEKPTRSSVPKGVDPKSVDAVLAAKLLSLPREIGKHPEDGEPIIANLGRYGPYVQHQKTYANLANFEDLFEVGLNRAVTLIADKIANPGRGRTAAKVLKDLGAHPDNGDPMQVLEGRYGPYVKNGKINATIPKDVAPDAVTVEQAVEWIAAKAAKGPKKKKKKAAPKKKAAAKKKPAAKKKAEPKED